MEEQSILGFMAQVIHNLEKSMSLPKSSIVFCKEGDLKALANVYNTRHVPGQPYVIGFRDVEPEWGTENRFLLGLVTEEIWSIFQDPAIFYPDGRAREWFYSFENRVWHTEETLAEALHEQVSQDAFAWILSALGIDPLVVSTLCDMTYEKDHVSGCLAFWTGQAVKAFKNLNAFHFQTTEHVKFIRENLNFVRKQLAGAKNGGLLFVREDANNPAEYIYKGYLSEVEKVFVTVWFCGHGSWVLRLGGKHIFRVKSRYVFGLNDPMVEVRREIDKELGSGMSKKLNPVLQALQKQGHGTSVIFLDMEDPAASEMFKNLEKQNRALKAENIRIDDTSEENIRRLMDMLEDISRVDGALVWDYRTQSLVYTNVVVDGKAILPGKREFGARRNAVACGIANLANYDSLSRNTKAIAVIFSEDGGIYTVSVSDCKEKLKQLQKEGAAGTPASE